VSSVLRSLRDYVVNLSAFEERSIIDESDGVPNQMYHWVEDEFLIFMKSSQIETLISFRHPCIAAPIGFVFPTESDRCQELKIVGFDSECCSLAEVLSVRPTWWTSTVKAKVIAGIVLGLRFMHSLGLLHGHLTGNNIVLNSDHCIQIVYFHPIPFKVDKSQGQERPQFGSFSGKGWTQKTDVCAFASILFEIVVGRPANGDVSVPTNIPSFVSKLIEFGLKSRRNYSFHDVLGFLKENDFQIENGVGSTEVFAFVNWVESAE
jgi:serine/threonine protein kinase